MLVDTHCHIQDDTYPLEKEETIARARKAGVEKMICVGTDSRSSQQAIELAASHPGIYASVGVHPHEAQHGWNDIDELAGLKPVAIGEIGLDFFYTHSPRKIQINALESQIEIALKYNLPIIFHVRDAFDDFWPIFDNFHGIRGELHSFTDTQVNIEQAFARGLYIGVNGISTFTKDTAQRELFASLPLERIVLETDAPFLTPAPFRGRVNEPAFVRNVAEYHGGIRGLSIEEVAHITTANATALFAL